MKIFKSLASPLNWPAALLFIVLAVASFHLAYLPTSFGPTRLMMVVYLICLIQLARLKTARQSFYAGLITALLCIAPQLICFWNIFNIAAVPLWTVLAVWIAVFVAITHATLVRFGPFKTALLVPIVWTGLEYFRSELYYLKFSWLNVGYAFSGSQLFPLHDFGMYGVGFVIALLATLFFIVRWLYAVFFAIIFLTLLSLSPAQTSMRNKPEIHIAGMQMEFPSEPAIPAALDKLAAKYPDADLLVLSEYTLTGPVPDLIKNWCRNHHRYLVIGGEDPAPKNNYYDSAFVVGPTGEVIFRQVKSVPIQFFKDGLPAPEQTLWNSPWGKIGFCVCYDFSYTRVVDRLVKMGAQIIIVPTMDVADWGKRQHELHALVAPVRAAEYRVPIFRLASSGISQAVSAGGGVLASAPFPGEGETLVANFQLPAHGSLPADRLLAPVAVAMTGVLILVLCFGKRKVKLADPSAEIHASACLPIAPKH
jgi:apolipoprotein N-acyltransferase